MANNQEYTFEDWLNDPEETYRRRLMQADGTIQDLDLVKTGHYPKVLLKEGKISEDTFHKIRQEQEKAYNKAVAFHIQKSLDQLEKKVNNSPDADEYLIYRKKRLKEQLEEAKPRILEQVISGEKELRPITANIYKDIMNKDPSPKLPYIGHVHTGHDQYNMSRQISPHFKFKIIFEEYLRVKKLLAENTSTTNHQQKTLDEFVTEFTADTKYGYDLIFNYLNTWTKLEGIPNRRAKTKTKLEEDDFNIPHDGTLKNWEDKWENYRGARTG